MAVQEANVQGAEQAEKEQKALQLELEQKSKLKLESEQNSKLKLEQMSKLQLELEQKSKLEEEKKKQKEEQELGDQKQRSTTPTDGESKYACITEQGPCKWCWCHIMCVVLIIGTAI